MADENRVTYGELRAAVLEYLRSVREDTQTQVPQGLPFLKRLEDQGRRLADADYETTRQLFIQLAHEGVIAHGTRTKRGIIGSSSWMQWPFYVITEYGKQVLANGDPEPHDPDGYLAALKARVPTVDADAIRYLEESLRCFRCGTMLASAVMLGCAAEKAMLALIESFSAAIADPNGQTKFAKELSKNWTINHRYGVLWSRLEPIAKDLPSELGDELHTILDRVFDLIRSTRNDAGHPTGKAIGRDVVRSNFIIFPAYCERVYGLIAHFKANQI